MELAATRSTESNTELGGRDMTLAALARPVAARAGPLLTSGRALLLSLTMTREQLLPVTMCWNGPAEPVALRSTLDLELPNVHNWLVALELAGEQLIAELSRRWPINAVPSAIGIVTDGGGVVFSSDHPSPLSPNWLALHQAGLCAPTTLLAFSGFGAWDRLTSTVASRRVH